MAVAAVLTLARFGEAFLVLRSRAEVVRLAPQQCPVSCGSMDPAVGFPRTPSDVERSPAAENDERFRIFAETASDAIIVMDEDSVILFANPAVERIFGYSASELAGHALEVLIPQRLRAGHHHGVARYIRTGRRHIPWSGVEVPGLHKNGTEIPVEISFGEYLREGRHFFTSIVRDVSERNRAAARAALESAVFRVLASEAPTPEAAGPLVLGTLAEHLAWQTGALWERTSGKEELWCRATWHAPANPHPEFEALSRSTVFAPGEGLPGRVWASGEAAWIADIAQETGLPRAAAAVRAGLRTALAFPIRVEGEIWGVLEFFTAKTLPPDRALLASMNSVGTAIGQFLQRKYAEQELVVATEALRRQSQLTETVMNNATAALFMMDARGHCTFMNPAAETMTGFRFGEIRDMPLHYAIHHHRPDGTPYPMAECPIDRALPENFDVRAHEDVFIRKDGSFFPVTCAASPIFENGVPVGTVVEVRDVSDERRTQRAILEGGARARFITEAMPQKVWTADPDGSIDYVNQRTLDYAGLASEEMLDWGWKQIIHPDDWEENLRAWQHSVATGDDFQLEHRFRRADGEYRWHLSRGIARRDEGGAIIMWVGTNTDIDDQKRAAEERQRLLTLARTDRERLEQIFTVAPAVMAIYSGPEQVITLVNPTWEQTVGKPNAVGKPFREVFPEFAESGLFGLVDQVYETGESYENPELMVPLERWGSGVLEETAWNMVWLALPAREGQTGRDILLHAVEVTEHVRARREIEAARALAEEANRSKSQFLANMSHELRTPLNAIGGYVDLIEMGIRGPVSQQQESDLKRIKRAQQHLLGLINDVLNYAKLEAGRIEFHIEDVPVDAALADMEALIAPQARGKGIAYRCCAGDTAITARADREKLQQIVLNLVSNAVKFTDSGGEVEVTWDARDEAVEIYVRDTGLGIPPEKLASVFEPFVQVDADLTRTVQGTGLGLAISRELARSMDGNLTAASVPGEGSTFTLTLPRAG